MSSLKDREILTLEIVTCKLLLLKRLQFHKFFNSGLFAGYFFLYHLAPPSRGELTPKSPAVELIGMRRFLSLA